MEYYIYNINKNEFDASINQQFLPVIRVFRFGNLKNYKGMKFTPNEKNIETFFKEFMKFRTQDL